MRNAPLIVSAQLFATVVSRVPVNPVMSILAIVVAAASVVVPLGLPLKIALFDAIGVHAHAAPPDVLDQLAPVFHAPPAPIRWQFPAATPQLGAATTRTAPRTQLL